MHSVKLTVFIEDHADLDMEVRVVAPEHVAAVAGAPIARYATPFSASGISAMMISALKMIADRIALFGVARCITLSAPSGPGWPGVGA